MRMPLNAAWILAAALLLLPTPATADGTFVWTNEKIDILEPEQKAFIYFDEGWQDLVISVKFEGAPEEFGWIVPLPSVPEMHAENALLFELLSKSTQNRQYRRSRQGAMLTMRLGAGAVGGVHVLKSETVGIYESTILESDKGSSLRVWLRDNNYQVRPNADRVFQRYIDKGWVFAALKIRPQAADSAVAGELTSGTIQPVRFRFRCQEPVFPLEISSLNTGASDVLIYLLARDVLMPRAREPHAWSVQVNSDPSHHRWISQYAGTTETYFLPDDSKTVYLTKHRARFEPAQMKDVFFVPYDPIGFLDHPDSTVRIEAVVDLGLRQPEGAEAHLLCHLERANAGRETYATLWALGEVGGAASEEVLLQHMSNADIDVRLEAAVSLGRIGSERALPYYIKGLTEDNEMEDRTPSSALGTFQRVCFDNIVRSGDASCQEDLRQRTDAREGAMQWDYCARSQKRAVPLMPSGNGIAPGVLSLAALAACGEEEACQQIVDALVTGGEVTKPRWIRLAARGKGSINNFPRGFELGFAVLTGPTMLRTWSTLTWAHDLFAVDVEFRDRLYRSAAGDERLADMGKVLLLSSIENPTSGDIEDLMGIWDAAIRPPVDMAEVANADYERRAIRLRNARYVGHIVGASTIHYNYTAVSVAYAMNKHKRLAELERLLKTAPKNDPVLHAEIIYAMAKTGDPRFQDAAAAYVRDAWAYYAAATAFDTEMRLLTETANAHQRALTLRFAPFDLSYRTRALTAYLCNRDPSLAKELITDRTLPPYLRLYFMSMTNYFRDGFEDLLPVAQKEAVHLLQEQDNPTVRELARQTQETLQRIEQSAANRKESLQVVR